MPGRLPLRSILDPRPAAVAASRPLADAVNIPLSELPARPHELPPRDREILVAAGFPESAVAVEWLLANGRAARLCARAESPTNMEGGRLWEPSEFLAACVSSLPAGRALEVACGTGRDAVYLASLGWDVTAIDVLPDALERCVALERHAFGTGGVVRWICADLEAPGEESRPATGAFDLITTFRYLHRPLFERLRGALAPGGSLIYETFTTTHRARHGKPRRDEFVLQSGELRTLASPLHVCDYSEGWRSDGSHTARLWARSGAFE